MKHLIETLFGPGTYGVTGNLIAWAVCGIPTVLGGLWHHRRQMRREFAKLRHPSAATTAAKSSTAPSRPESL